MKKTGRFAVPAAILLAVLSGCAKSAQDQEDSDESLLGKATGCNLLLITLDTTRADRLGCYGWPRASTPALDSLAKSGIRFEQAFSQVPITLPSHAVLLTGTYPPENGLRVNGRNSLTPELTTLAEVFAQHGYRTAAFIASSVLDSRYGLDRGFDVYDDDMPVLPSGRRRAQRPGNMVCDNALKWLGQVQDQSFMCWVHFYDPHTPYEAPPEFLAKTGNPYDAEVAFVDANVGRLLDWLRSADLASNTLIAVVGDHGESLGEHGYEWHSLLVYESIMRVPLILALPGVLPKRRTCSGVTRIVDVMPLVLQLMGWAVPQHVSGESFLGALTGREPAPRRSYGETDYPLDSFGWSELRCWVDEKWKYIRAPRVELYDRRADPGELRNLAEDRPDVVDRLERELAAAEARFVQRDSAVVQLDAETLERLRSLGYVRADGSAHQASVSRKDPKDMADIEHDFRRAEWLLSVSRTDDAIGLLKSAIARSPESFVLVERLGKAFAVAGRLEEAQEQLTRALAMNPGFVDTYLSLARVLARRGRFEQAVKATDKALGINSSHEEARQVRAQAVSDLARQRSRIAACREELDVDPDSVELRVRLCHLLTRSGNAEEPLKLLREGLARDPSNPELADATAWLLATSWRSDLRNPAEAVRLALSACRATEHPSAAFLNTLAAAYAEAGQFNLAGETARKAAYLATEAGDRNLASELDRRIDLFNSGQPYHQMK